MFRRHGAHDAGRRRSSASTASESGARRAGISYGSRSDGYDCSCLTAFIWPRSRTFDETSLTFFPTRGY
jgi:hypothetical protein